MHRTKFGRVQSLLSSKFLLGVGNKTIHRTRHKHQYIDKQNDAAPYDIRHNDSTTSYVQYRVYNCLLTAHEAAVTDRFIVND